MPSEPISPGDRDSGRADESSVEESVDAPEAESGSGTIGQVLLGGEPRYTKIEVARLAGVDLERAERLWQAMGFPHVEPDAVAFTDADVAALVMLVRLVAAEVITPEIETTVARSLAQAMSRLAAWQIGIFKSVLGEQFGDDLDSTADFVRAIMPVMERLQGYIWRRHLAETADRELVEGRGITGSRRTLVVGFADIVGYTRLVRDFTEFELARLIDEFEDVATQVIAQNRGRIVKTVGDEVMFVADSARDGAEIALRLNERTAENSEVPPLRIGVARGEVLARFGDVYGSTVNVASRLTSLAKPASTLVDREVAAELANATDYSLVSIGERKVQGFKGLRAWALRRADQ